jgi:hypothetical protein
LGSSIIALFRGTKVAKHPIGPKMIFGCVFVHFANLRRAKDENSCFGPKCTISVYQSCEATILLHWTQNDVWGVSKHFANLRQVKRCKNLYFRYECTILGYQSFEASIIVD